jgi:DNA-binding cell septation regulator SpoVG
MNIQNIVRVDKGCVVAKFDLSFENGIVLRELTWMRKDDGTHWISYPSRSYVDSMGQKKYFQYIKFENSEKKRELEDEIFLLLQREKNKEELPF